MIIKLETFKNTIEREKELNNLRYFLTHYYHSSDFKGDPFSCHMECKEENCEKCIKEHIDWKIKRINDEGILYE